MRISFAAFLQLKFSGTNIVLTHFYFYSLSQTNDILYVAFSPQANYTN
jgi:hypothetical protein